MPVGGRDLPATRVGGGRPIGRTRLRAVAAARYVRAVSCGGRACGRGARRARANEFFCENFQSGRSHGLGRQIGEIPSLTSLVSVKTQKAAHNTRLDTNPLATAFPSHVPAAMDDKIAQFCQVTGCVDPYKAKFFLESSNGEIDAAISAFFGAPRPSVSPEISHP